MPRLDVLAYKLDVDNTDSFNEDVISYSGNSLILNWNSNKVWVQYKPDNIKFDKLTINFLKLRSQRWRCFFLPLITLAHIIQVSKLFILICWKFRPKIFIVENFLEGMIAGIIRRCGLVSKSIYLPCDWFAGYKYKKLTSNIANNLIFPYIDYFACRLNDIVVDRPGNITESRNKYWGRKIPTTERQFIQQPRIQVNNTSIDKKRANICFIGELREDSGVDLAIKALTKIRKKLDVTFKIIGHKRLSYEYFLKLCKEHNVEEYVKFLGFIGRKDFNSVLSDCLCGLNILITKNSYSSYGTPSKIMHYFQHLLPVIVTEGVSPPMVRDIKEKELGCVIGLSEDELVEAVLRIYSGQETYRKNIKDYIESFPKTGILSFLKEDNLQR